MAEHSMAVHINDNLDEDAGLCWIVCWWYMRSHEENWLVGQMRIDEIPEHAIFIDSFVLQVPTELYDEALRRRV